MYSGFIRAFSLKTATAGNEVDVSGETKLNRKVVG